jgi:hypothetical protein
MAIRRTTITVSGTAGGAGASTAYAISDDIVDGLVLAVHIAYAGSPPATTDVIIVEANNSPAMPILTVSDANTDGWFQPMAAVEDTAGAAVTNAVQQIPVSDYVKVTVDDADDGDGAVVTVVWAE